MKIYTLTTMSLPKIAVLAAGLASTILAATMSPQPAHAYPSQADNCANCHIGSTSTATTATPSTTTPVAGATYTVAITLSANPTGGNSGYAIVPVAPDTQKTNGGNIGSDTSFTATMTAPAAAGTYTYTVFTNMGSKATGQTGSATYSLNVAAGSTTPPVTTTSTPQVTTTGPTLITATPTQPVVGLSNVHGPYALNTAQCGICHRAHAAKAPNLLGEGSQSTLCFTCHDGTGSNSNISAQYALVRPVNNPAKREYYSHDAIAASTHTESLLDEFGVVTNGVVINRHSECADCHNAHQATVTATRNSVQMANGWDASSRLAGVSGVSIVNGAAGAAPAYTFLSGADTNLVPSNLVTREYQLCFKCHSGFTTLTDNTGLKPSQYALDKGVEFNPANPSFHPVEAAGRNNTDAMKASLAGTSPYKLWNFTVDSTIRCLNCHASSTTADVPLPLPGSALAPHTSSNRGILIRNYQDRVLKSTDAAYSAGDFALCYVCHGEAPFTPNASSDPNAALQTNFSLHSKHLTGLMNKSSGPTASTDIDTPGDGVGNAICAECHFRLHSTTNKVGAQTLTGDPTTGSRLVNFAPNVTPSGTTLSWTTTGTGSGSCTLTCHGKVHSGFTYSP